MARDWLVELAAPELTQDGPIVALKSPKSRLQEYTQRHSGGRPSYRLVDVTGPDHEKTFRVEVHVDGQAARASARVRRDASRRPRRRPRRSSTSAPSSGAEAVGE